MGTSPVHSFSNLKIRAAVLLPFVIVLLSSNPLFAQLTVNCTPQAVSCNGGNNGQIEVAVTGGTGSYECSLDNVSWVPAGGPVVSPYIFTGLVAGTYHVYVRDNGGSQQYGDQADVIVSQPDPLEFTLSGQNWSCSSAVGCSGSILVSPTGGTAPYTIDVNGTTGTSPFTGLCAGSYTVTVTDANGCPSTPQPSQVVTIVQDNLPPTGCIFPADVTISSGYNPIGIVDTFNFIVPGDNYYYQGAQAHPYAPDTFISFFDATQYNNLQLKISARQNDVEPFQNADFLKISYTSNGGGTWTDVLTDHCRWQATDDNESGPCSGETNWTSNAAWIDLPNGGGNVGFGVRVVCFTESASRAYAIDRLRVRRNSTSSSVTLAQSGQPSDCTDDHSAVTVTPKDTLMHWYCSGTGNLEFKFQRIWQVQDQCGNKVRHFQNIFVGSSPSISDPSDITLNFCQNNDVNITAPVNSDNCYIRDTLWTITRTGFSANGTGNINNFDFPVPTAVTVYDITWTVRDSVGLTNTTDQQITFNAPMQVNITPDAGDDHFCSGENVGFSVSISGGTGTYIHPPANILPTLNWDNTIEDGSGHFTTNELVLGTSEIIQMNVSDDGSCSTGDQVFGNGGVFTIHQNISTNPLQRIP